MVSVAKWTERGFMPFVLEVLTPVHVSSGRTLSPLEYVLGEGVLYRIDLDSWLERNARRPDVLSAIESGNLKAIHAMLQKLVDPKEYALSSEEIPAQLGQKIASHISDAKSETTNEISEAMRNPLTGIPYIPGSSLKGSISTAIVNAVDTYAATQGRSLKDSCDPGNSRDRGYSRWMDGAFGKISEHAMKALKVSDCPAPSGCMRIVSAVEKGLQANKTGTPKPPAEALRPGSRMPGRLLMSEVEGTVKLAIPRWGNNVTWDFPSLRKICNDFYLKRFKEEKERFYRLAHFAETKKALDAVEKKLALLNGDNPPMLLRVGHYSHVECVTVSNNAPKTRMAKGRALPSGTTRTLADGVLPFGWVLLHPCGVEEYKRIAMDEERAAHSSWEAGMHANLEALASERMAAKEAEAARAQAAKEAESRRLAKEEEKRRLASMPEDVRLAEQIRNGALGENEVMQVYARLSEWSGDSQRNVAEALRDCWRKTGKWDGKQSKKQKEKIARVSAIIANP